MHCVSAEAWSLTLTISKSYTQPSYKINFLEQNPKDFLNEHTCWVIQVTKAICTQVWSIRVRGWDSTVTQYPFISPMKLSNMILRDNATLFDDVSKKDRIFESWLNAITCSLHPRRNRCFRIPSCSPPGPVLSREPSGRWLKSLFPQESPLSQRTNTIHKRPGLSQGLQLRKDANL